MTTDALLKRKILGGDLEAARQFLGRHPETTSDMKDWAVDAWRLATQLVAESKCMTPRLTPCKDQSVKKAMLGAEHQVKASDLRFAASIIHKHVTGSRPAQAALHVKSHRESLFDLISRLMLAAAFEEQNLTN